MRFLLILAGLVGGYLAGVGVGALLITLLSTNPHDKSVEMVMTAAFVTGPIGAVVGAIIAVRFARAKAPPKDAGTA